MTWSGKKKPGKKEQRTPSISRQSPPFPSFPRKRRAVRGKSCGGKRKEIGSRVSSWPGLTRPSTPSAARNKDVDARIKSAQDDSKWFPQNLNQVILAEVISPDSPARKRGPRVPVSKLARHKGRAIADFGARSSQASRRGAPSSRAFRGELHRPWSREIRHRPTCARCSPERSYGQHSIGAARYGDKDNS
jgi:hypothetical protein